MSSATFVCIPADTGKQIEEITVTISKPGDHGDELQQHITAHFDAHLPPASPHRGGRGDIITLQCPMRDYG